MTTTQQEAALAPRLLLSVGEVAAALGCGRDTVYRLMTSGALPSVTVGDRLRRVDVTICALSSTLSRNPAGAMSAPTIQTQSMPRLLLTPEEAAKVLGIGRTKVYELMLNNALEIVKIGSSRRIPSDSLASFVETLRTRSARAGQVSSPTP